MGVAPRGYRNPICVHTSAGRYLDIFNTLEFDVETAATPVARKWDPSHIFEDDAAFLQAMERLTLNLPGLAALSGTLANSAMALAETLERVTVLHEEFSLLSSYASLLADEDTRAEAPRKRRRKVELLATEFSRSISFLRPEILALEPEVIEGFISQENRLHPFTHYLRDLMRQREHVLNEGEERIMAESGLITGNTSSLFQILNTTELPRPEIQLTTGEQVRLTPVNFQKHRSTRERKDRHAIFSNYFQSYADFKETLAQNLFSGVKAHIFRARSRHYPSSLSAALDPDNVPLTVYRNLIKQVHDHLPLLHRYFDCMARMIGSTDLAYPDLYCPLTSVPPHQFSVEEAEQLVIECTAPLGSEYGAGLAQGFSQRWVDWFPADGKRAGAYAQGSAYRIHPYVLMNYVHDYDSVSTLAHEMGHALHSHFSNKQQPFATADYSIFVAEVASTLNEALLNQHLLQQTPSRDEEIFLLGRYLDGIRGTLFRQTMFAEFELEIHERVERGETLTGESLDELYLGLLRLYHGHDQGHVQIETQYGVEWAAIPHMYYNFYVYQYSTSFTASTALSQKVLGKEKDAVKKYIQFISAGGSKYPIDLLREAGVDMTTAEPFDKTMVVMNRTMDEIEAILEKKAK
jgi:oligoendopeptidase F